VAKSDAVPVLGGGKEQTDAALTDLTNERDGDRERNRGIPPSRAREVQQKVRR
jgi:hypothetical protein